MQYRLGLVLSGGGSRGLAHVGVLRALNEAGIAPDCISGTSAGAVVGALYAAGYDADAMIDFFDVASPFRFSKMALGRPGFFDTHKVAEDFRRFFPADSFEALGKRLFVTATDLARARREVFSSGQLVLPLIASSSVPLVFTPTIIDGRPFADGGVLDNFPVDLLLGLCDVVIGVYASPLPARRENQLSSSIAVAHRAFEIGMHFASRQRFHRCDLVLCPQSLTSFTLFDVKRHHEIAGIGYQAAQERMDDIRRLLAARV